MNRRGHRWLLVRSRGRWCRVFAFLVALTFGQIFIPGYAVGEDAVPEGREVIEKGTVELGLLGGFWQAVDPFQNAPSTNRSAVYVLPQMGMVLTDELGSGYFTGKVSLLLEPLFAHYYQPFSASAFGGSLVGKYNFLSFGRWVPFWDAGAGMLWTDLAPRILEQSTQFNFVLQTGPGVQFLLSRRSALTAGLRFHHISNAGIGERNTGLNAVLVYFGVSFFLPR